MLVEVTHHATFTLEAGETFRFKPGSSRPEVHVTSFTLDWTGRQRPSRVTLHGTLTATGHTHKSASIPDVRPSVLPAHVQRAVITITQ